MNGKLALGMLLVVTSVLLAGCVPDGDSISINYIGSVNDSEGQFTMQGHLVIAGGIPDRDVYRNVSVGLYTANGTRFYTEQLGDVNPAGSYVPVNVSTRRKPQYVVFESPDFWTEPMTSRYYRRLPDGGYQRVSATSPDGLPV